MGIEWLKPCLIDKDHMNQPESQPSPTVPKNQWPTSKIALVLGAIIVVGFLWALLLPAFSGSRRSPSIKCVSNIKQICLGGIEWAYNRQTNQLPSDFLGMSNELVAYRILICPSDWKRSPARDWASFTSKNCSYEMIGPGVAIGTTNVFIRCKIHGNVGLANGNWIRVAQW